MNLKSALITGLCVMLAFAGCRQEAEELRIGKSEVRLHAGETVKVGSNISAQWSSDDDFIASVDSEGNITGHHVGSTSVVAAAGGNSRKCLVEVVPRYDTYIEPAYELLGCPASLLETAETRELVRREEKKIIYKGEKPYIDRVEYRIYDTDEGPYISRAHIFIADTYLEEVNNFLSERYRLFLGSDGIPQYYNDFARKATRAATVVRDIGEPGYFVVIYELLSRSSN